MILLGSENKVLQESIKHRMEADKKEPCDAKLYDFDEVFYRLYIDRDDRSKMLVSVQTPNWKQIRNDGSEDLIKEKLGDYLQGSDDDGAKFEIQLDEKSAERADVVSESFSKLRIYALGGPLYRYCKALSDGKPLNNIYSFAFRHDTYMWIIPRDDRVTVVYALEFAHESDRIIANQVLSEFPEVRRLRDLQTTPSVGFSAKDPPGELQGQQIPQFNRERFVGFFSILLLQSHVKANKLERAVENVIGFRAYLTYHIKCAKAYFHQSMRARTKKSLQVLNRARYEPDDERKKKKIIKSAK